MRYAKLLSLGAAMALLVSACGGGPVVDAASSPLVGPIAVHGDWTIDIYNEDGSLDRTLEFENALVGGNFIPLVLDGSATPGQWLVRLYGGAVPGPCLTTSATTGVCTLTATTERNTSNASLIVSASVIAENDGQIAIVDTKFATCDPDVAPSDCPAQYDPAFDNDGIGLTEKTLDATESVSEGQSIQVEVVISFKSG